MAIYSIRKWRKNSKGTGAILDLSYYDEQSEKWLNVKANIPFASQYAGKDASDVPATLCAVKDGVLIIMCTKFDSYTYDAAQKDKQEAQAKKKTHAGYPPIDEDALPF